MLPAKTREQPGKTATVGIFKV
ncbi:hypothetical protein SBA6_270029 [Candidatus Sulfopaludibacter sp. SbA6]|nr:hypothetical protein SBA6_270029 [Candidatus Sulfopaludibacter sp. SbA6]